MAELAGRYVPEETRKEMVAKKMDEIRRTISN